MKTLIPKQAILDLLTQEALKWREDVRTVEAKLQAFLYNTENIAWQLFYFAEVNPYMTNLLVSPFVAHFCERLTTLIYKETDDALEYKRVERLAFDLHQEMRNKWQNTSAIADDMVNVLMDSILKLYKQ